jgi:hypothetical protein
MKPHRHTSALFSAAALGAALLAACNRNEPVSLELDFSSRPQWCYTVNVDVRGRGALADGGRAFGATAAGSFCAAPAAGARVDIAFRDMRIGGDLFAPAEAANLERRLASDTVRFVWRSGILSPQDTTELPALRVGDWSLQRVLARTVPSLPAGPVAVGSTWEAERWLPLRGAFGDGVGHLYQVFTLDSVTTGSAGRLAHVSWTFSYRVEVLREESAGSFASVPRAGKGSGRATLSLNGRFLQDALVLFHAPVDSGDTAALHWTEQSEIRLAE